MLCKRPTKQWDPNSTHSLKCLHRIKEVPWKYVKNRAENLKSWKSFQSVRKLLSRSESFAFSERKLGNFDAYLPIEKIFNIPRYRKNWQTISVFQFLSTKLQGKFSECFWKMNISYVHKGLFVSAIKETSTSYTYLPVNMKCVKSDKVSSK